MKIIRISDGLGNQMFQYAFILNYKLKGENIKLDISQEEITKQHNGFELKNVFNIEDELFSKLEKIKLLGPIFYYKNIDFHFLKILRKIIQQITFKKYTPSFKRYIGEYETVEEKCFNEKYLNVKNKKTYFQGYFQSYKYFRNIEDKVKKIFTFPGIREHDKKNFKILEEINNSESISIHIRRGDYLKFPNLNICGYDYYEKAFKFIKNKLKNKNLKFFIFSNDVNWCKENLLFLKNERTFFIDWNQKEYSYIDMQLMSKCKNNIIPNSTFSWWGAYLNNYQNKTVIAPKYWFSNIKTSRDRCDDSWVLLS